MADKEIQKWKKKMLTAIKSENSPRSKLSAYVTIRMSALSHLSAFYSFFADEYYENYRLIERVKSDFDKEERGIVKGILEEGVAKWMFSIDDTEGTVSTLLNVVRGLEHFWLEEKNAARLKKHIDSLLSLFLRGLLKRWSPAGKPAAQKRSIFGETRRSTSDYARQSSAKQRHLP